MPPTLPKHEDILKQIALSKRASAGSPPIPTHEEILRHLKPKEPQFSVTKGFTPDLTTAESTPVVTSRGTGTDLKETAKAIFKRLTTPLDLRDLPEKVNPRK